MSKIEIRTNGSVGTIEVDGVQLPSVFGYRVAHAVGGMPEVTVDMFAREQRTTISEGVLKIGDLQAPEALERALLAYLQAKYPAVQPDVLEVTNLGSNVRRFADVPPHRTGD